MKSAFKSFILLFIAIALVSGHLSFLVLGLALVMPLWVAICVVCIWMALLLTLFLMSL